MGHVGDFAFRGVQPVVDGACSAVVSGAVIYEAVGNGSSLAESCINVEGAVLAFAAGVFSSSVSSVHQAVSLAVGDIGQTLITMGCRTGEVGLTSLAGVGLRVKHGAVGNGLRGSLDTSVK